MSFVFDAAAVVLVCLVLWTVAVLGGLLMIAGAVRSLWRSM
jgi:hypothetical protein